MSPSNGATAPVPPSSTTGTTGGAGTTSSTAAAGTTAGAGATSSTAGAGAGAGVSSNAGDISPKSMDLLKRRYGLPESLIRFGLPNSLVQISGEEMSGVVGCSADAQRLDDQSRELGIGDLHVYYAAYTPVSTVVRSENLFKKPRVGSVVFNSIVANEKLKSSKVLKELEDQFQKSADQLKALGGKEKRQILMKMRSEFSGEVEMVTCRLELLEDLKEKALDNLIFLELDSTSRLSDFEEAMWIIQHHRPFDYKRIVPGSNEISPSGIISVRKSILERRGGRFATSNVFMARSFVLAVFGRIHMETVLEQVIEHAKGALKTYMTAIDDVLIYEAMAIASIKEQQRIVSCLTRKRSLIGCYPVYLAGDEDEDEDDDESDEYTVDFVEEEEEDYDHYSTLEEVCIESPIVDSSEIDSDDELGDDPESSEPDSDEDHNDEEPKHGFLRFHWNFGANPSDEVKRYKRYLSFLENCY